MERTVEMDDRGRGREGDVVEDGEEGIGRVEGLD